MIRKAPGCQRKHLLQQTGFKGQDLDELLNTLAAREDAYEAEKRWRLCE